MRIHGLDTLRILAEYVVVQFHIQKWLMNGVIQSETHEMFITDLMSFFFVLSGTVCMMNPPLGTTTQFIVSKMCKVAPVYYICLIWDIISILTTNDQVNSCPADGLCIAGHFVLLAQWANCANKWQGLSWYMQILMTFWIIFPFIHKGLKSFFSTHVWPKLLVLYLLSMSIQYALPFNTKYFAPVNFIGFVMGCGVSQTFENPLSPLWCVAGLVGIIVVYVFNHLYLQFQSDACVWLKSNVCDPFDTYGQPDIEAHTCSTYLVLFGSKMNIVWMLLIHTVATTPNCLEYEIFKTINNFSLFVYMFHLKIMHILIVFSQLCRLPGLFGITFMMPIVYYLSYCVSLLYKWLENTVIIFKNIYFISNKTIIEV